MNNETKKTSLIEAKALLNKNLTTRQITGLVNHLMKLHDELSYDIRENITIPELEEIIYTIWHKRKLESEKK